jgi:tetratricopeptide (TPR) repeat protein
MATREAYPFPPVLNGSAEECYKLGIKQRELGFPNQARMSLKRTVELDPKGVFGIKAERYIRTELPLNLIPSEALKLNNEAWNLVRSEHVSEAKILLEKCISMYPDFEWPRNHLSGIYRSEGKLREANELIDHTLSINPQYVSAWLARSDLRCAANDMKGAILCAQKAVELDPDNKSAKQRLNELTGIKEK